MAILGHLHLVLILLHCAVHVDCHIGIVMCTVGIIGNHEGISCHDGEVGYREQFSGGGGIIISLFAPFGFFAASFRAAMGNSLGGMVTSLL